MREKDWVRERDEEEEEEEERYLIIIDPGYGFRLQYHYFDVPGKGLIKIYW